MTASRPWYRRNPGKFIAATLHLTLEEKGAYSMVLDMIYDRGGPIPDDSRYISRVCGCSTRRWNQIRERLIEDGKLVSENGVLRNLKAEDEMASAALRSEQAKAAGEAGGRKTAEKTEKNQRKIEEKNPIAAGKNREKIEKKDGDTSKINDLPEIPLPDPPASPLQRQTNLLRDIEYPLSLPSVERGGGVGGDCASSIPPPVKANETKAKPKRKVGTRLPEDWHPDAGLWEWAMVTKGMTFEEVNHELEMFKNHWQAASTANAVKLDWRAAFRNWCLRSIERGLPFRRHGNKPAGGPRSLTVDEAERRSRILDAIGDDDLDVV